MILVLRRRQNRKGNWSFMNVRGIQGTVEFCGVCDKCGDCLGTKVYGAILESLL